MDNKLDKIQSTNETEKNNVCLNHDDILLNNINEKLYKLESELNKKNDKIIELETKLNELARNQQLLINENDFLFKTLFKSDVKSAVNISLTLANKNDFSVTIPSNTLNNNAKYIIHNPSKYIFDYETFLSGKLKLVGKSCKRDNKIFMDEYYNSKEIENMVISSVLNFRYR